MHFYLLNSNKVICKAFVPTMFLTDVLKYKLVVFGIFNQIRGFLVTFAFGYKGILSANCHLLLLLRITTWSCYVVYVTFVSVLPTTNTFRM